MHPRRDSEREQTPSGGREPPEVLDKFPTQVDARGAYAPRSGRVRDLTWSVVSAMLLRDGQHLRQELVHQPDAPRVDHRDGVHRVVPAFLSVVEIGHAQLGQLGS